MCGQACVCVWCAQGRAGDVVGSGSYCACRAGRGLGAEIGSWQSWARGPRGAFGYHPNIQFLGLVPHRNSTRLAAHGGNLRCEHGGGEGLDSPTSLVAFLLLRPALGLGGRCWALGEPHQGGKWGPELGPSDLTPCPSRRGTGEGGAGGRPRPAPRRAQAGPPGGVGPPGGELRRQPWACSAFVSPRNQAGGCASFVTHPWGLWVLFLPL